MAPARITVGLVGAGWIAPLHLAGFQEAADKAQVVAVCDLEEEKARDLAALVGAQVCTDYRRLIADPDIDLVDVLLPHHLHHPVGLAVLQARKHLLLEKPLAMTYRQALEICQTAGEAGVHFTVAENTRFVRAYIEADRLIREGKLGQITLVRTFLPANERIRLSSDDFWGKQAGCGGGVLLDSGAHTFYLLKWLFGGIEEIAAWTSQIYQVGSQVEDNADVRGRLANGAQFIGSFSFTAEIPHSERLEVYGTRGSLIIDQLVDPPAKLYADATDLDGTPVKGVEYDPLGWHYLSVVAEVQDFVDAISEDRPPAVDPLDCCYAVHVADQAYASARSGNRPVRVEEGSP
jgi:UDP-N-acetyl-2-amino-2-deoxyglucuronate dehydrogenase